MQLAVQAHQVIEWSVSLQGAKIGVLGANGAGKSSLMKILAGVDNTSDGRVVRSPGIRSDAGKQQDRGFNPSCQAIDSCCCTEPPSLHNHVCTTSCP